MDPNLYYKKDKRILKLIREKYKKNKLVKLLSLYCAIAELEEDFKSEKYKTSLITKHSGLSKNWIPGGLKILNNLGVIAIEESRNKGKFSNRGFKIIPYENINKKKKDLKLKKNIGYIYLIKKYDLVKIGCTKNIKSRLKRNKKKYKNPKVLFFHKVDNYEKIDKYLLDKYSNKRIVRLPTYEWFKLSKKEIKNIVDFLISKGVK